MIRQTGDPSLRAGFIEQLGHAVHVLSSRVVDALNLTNQLGNEAHITYHDRNFGAVCARLNERLAARREGVAEIINRRLPLLKLAACAASGCTEEDRVFYKRLGPACKFKHSSTVCFGYPPPPDLDLRHTAC